MSDGKLRYIASSMDSKLPYTLTKGVTATREGLVTNGYYGQIITEMTTEEWEDTYEGEGGWGLIPWPDAAEQLRYREGEPWCWADHKISNAISCSNELLLIRDNEYPVSLHRLAAILCDDAEAFRVLHWCVTEMGGQDEK